MLMPKRKFRAHKLRAMRPRTEEDSMKRTKILLHGMRENIRTCYDTEIYYKNIDPRVVKLLDRADVIDVDLAGCRQLSGAIYIVA